MGLARADRHYPDFDLGARRPHQAIPSVQRDRRLLALRDWKMHIHQASRNQQQPPRGTSPSPSIGNLTFLHFLELQDNNFSGFLPSTLKNLNYLQTFLTFNNNFINDILWVSEEQDDALEDWHPAQDHEMIMNFLATL